MQHPLSLKQSGLCWANCCKNKAASFSFFPPCTSLLLMCISKYSKYSTLPPCYREIILVLPLSPFYGLRRNCNSSEGEILQYGINSTKVKRSCSPECVQVFSFLQAALENTTLICPLPQFPICIVSFCFWQWCWAVKNPLVKERWLANAPKEII